MKKILPVITLILAVAACNQDIKEENAQLKEENIQLKQERNYQDTTITEFVDAFEEVQQNLAEIRQREKSISEVRSGGIENQADAKTKIMEDIEAINKLLEQNKRTIESLGKQTKEQEGRLANFANLVNNLRGQINEKNTQITRLKESLASTNFKMDQLNNKVGMLTEEKIQQKKTIQNQIKAMNTAYYAVGTSKELLESGVIDKEGGFIGIGRTKILADDFNEDYFTQINIRNTSSIPLAVGDSRVKIITPHPASSYTLTMKEKKPTALVINNKKEFWKSTKYLVIIID
jgi:DNA repair exonuclease SbcCD ATPase subunit